MVYPFFETGQNLLASLRWAEIVKKVDELKAIQKTLEHKRELETLKLPQLVAIGLENAGKSTIVERLAGKEVLPRDKEFCSRIVVIIEFRHDPTCPYTQPRLRLTLPNLDDDTPQIFDDVTSQTVITSIKRLNQEIKRRGLGVEMDKFVTLELSSNGVPTMNLVDLPGIITVRCFSEGEPADLAEKTEKLSLKYLCHEKTGGVLVVIDATIDNLRTSNAIRLLQDAQRERREAGGHQLNAVVVMTKTDKSFDNSWEDEEKNGPLWSIEDRLLGHGDTSEITHDVQAGFVAIKSRSTQSKKDCGIISQNEEELKYFLSHCSLQSGFVFDNATGQRQLSALGKQYLGLLALVERLDWIISNHLNEAWVPKKLKEQDQEELHLHEQLAPLGLAPQDVGIERLRQRISSVLDRGLAPKVIDELSAACFEGLEASSLSYPTLCEATCQAQDEFAKYREAIANNAFMKRFAEKIKSVINSCFEEDREGEIQLFRFEALKARLLSVLENKLHDESCLRNFKITASQCCHMMELKSCCQQDTSDWVVNFKELQVMLSSCMIIHFLKPVLHETSGIIPTTFGELDAMPSECADMAARRADLLSQLDNVELIRRTLKDLSGIPRHDDLYAWRNY